MAQSHNNEFIFPYKREILLERPSDNRYWVDEKYDIEEISEKEQIQLIDELKSILQKDHREILSKDLFCKVSSLFFSFSELSFKVKTILSNIFQEIVREFFKYLLDTLENKELNQLEINSLRNEAKIYIFFCEWFIECYLFQVKGKKKDIKKGRRKVGMKDDKSKGKKEKSKKKLIDDEIMEDQAKNQDEITDPNQIITVQTEHILKNLIKLINSNIKIIFKNKIIEEDFLNEIIKIGFDLLEIPNELKNSAVKEKIFEVLTLTLTKFSSVISHLSIKLSSKIVNFVLTSETLVSYLGDFISAALNGDPQMNKFGVDIIHQLNEEVQKKENFDNTALKNIGKFFITLSEKSPKIIYTNIYILIHLLDCDDYILRNSIIEVIGNIIVNYLCNLDNIDDVETRNNHLKNKELFIEFLLKRVYDKSSFSRAKVLQTFEKLCDNNTISATNYINLLDIASGRLKDEKSIVRKKALSLIGKIIMIYSIMFQTEAFLTMEEINEEISRIEKNIEQNNKIIAGIDKELVELARKAEENNMEVDSRENDFLKEIETQESRKHDLKEEKDKLEMMIDHFNDYKKVITTIDKITPLIMQLLGSKNIGDVHESIELFVILNKLRVKSSFLGIKKMLTLIIKPDENIKKKVMEAFGEIYFKKEIPSDMQANLLIQLTVSLNFSEMTCLRELINLALDKEKKYNFISEDLISQIWKIFLRNPEEELKKRKVKTSEEGLLILNSLKNESRAAFKILNTCADFTPNILLSKAELLTKHILSKLDKHVVDWNFVKESLIALQKISSMTRDISQRCLKEIISKIIEGHGENNNAWYLACGELIDTIFLLQPSPEKISHYIIVKLSRPLFINQSNNTKENNDVFLTQNIFSGSKPTQQQENDSKMAIDVVEDQFISRKIFIKKAIKLSQLFFALGHIALNIVIYAEKLENNIKKRKEEKNNMSDNNNPNEGIYFTNKEINKIAGGKEEEIEYDITLLHKIIEEEILYKNLFSKYIPLIENTAKLSLTDESETNLYLYKSAILTLCKFMCISPKFCEDHIPFLFELLEKDINPSLKLNVIAGFGDLVNRFPNVLNKYINKFFNCLHDKETKVCRYAMTVISHLVLNDMLKIKGEIVDICMLLESDDNRLKDLVNLFFYELNQKGNNIIYNIIPKALVKLSIDFKNIEYVKFQDIMKTLLKYVSKDKQTEGLIDKLFSKLKNSNDKIEWRNTTFCLSQLNYTEKNFDKFEDLYTNLKDKIEDEIVNENMNIIFNKFKKNIGNKDVIENVEKKMAENNKVNVVDKKQSKKKKTQKRNYSKMKNDKEEENDENEEVMPTQSKRMLRTRVTKKILSSQSEVEDLDSEYSEN